jgi:NRPS condensation-like uncharacterized protein
MQARGEFPLRGSGGVGGYKRQRLTAADSFMYTLEKRMIRQTEGSTNVCQYLLELDGKVNAETFSNYVNSLPELSWLASLAPVKATPISIPAWKSNEKKGSIPIAVLNSDELIPNEILNQKIKNDEHQLRFSVVHRSNGGTGLIFSWRHLIMDGYGAVLLLQQLAKLVSKLNDVIDPSPKKMLGANELLNATRAKFFIDKVSKRPLSSIAPKKKLDNQVQRIKTIQFNEAETASLDKLGLAVGAKFGRSPLYLAASARSVYYILERRGVSVKNFWIPVPKDLRKKGSIGPLLGNHASFMFYRIKGRVLNSFSDTVKSINEQMLIQVKSGISNDYDMLMRLLRRTPTPLYYFWIKGLRGGSLASFLFTVAADHPDELMNFQEHNVKGAWSFPSGVYPPGLSFAFMRFRNTLQLMICYFEGVITEAEADEMASSIRKDLLT